MGGQSNESPLGSDQDDRCLSRWSKSPPPLHTPPPASAQISVRTSPASRVLWTRTSVHIPCGPRPSPSAVRVCAGHRPADQAVMTDPSTGF